MSSRCKHLSNRSLHRLISRREYSYREQTKENWITILQLSTRWLFPKITELAVRELEALRLPPAEMISICNRYGIDDERLLDSYVELCKSPTLPTEADGNLMEMGTLINILQAREDAQRKADELGHESPTSASLEDSTLREILSKFFRKGLDPRSGGTSTRSEVQASNLNGEPAHRTGANATITMEEPQVPDRKAQSTSGPASHAVGGICATIESSQLMLTHRTIPFRRAARERKAKRMRRRRMRKRRKRSKTKRGKSRRNRRKRDKQRKRNKEKGRRRGRRRRKRENRNHWGTIAAIPYVRVNSITRHCFTNTAA